MKLKLKNTSTALLTASFIFACFMLCKNIPYGIRINRSMSLHHRLYFSVPFKEIKRGHYVSFRHPSYQKLLAKQIVGIPGDKIILKDTHIYINDFDCGNAFNKTSDGCLLTPQTAEVIPEGFVFVQGTHPQSFDSRYQQFGLLQIHQLQEVLWPIF